MDSHSHQHALPRARAHEPARTGVPVPCSFTISARIAFRNAKWASSGFRFCSLPLSRACDKPAQGPGCLGKWLGKGTSLRIKRRCASHGDRTVRVIPAFGRVGDDQADVEGAQQARETSENVLQPLPDNNQSARAGGGVCRMLLATLPVCSLISMPSPPCRLDGLADTARRREGGRTCARPPPVANTAPVSPASFLSSQNGAISVSNQLMTADAGLP